MNLRQLPAFLVALAVASCGEALALNDRALETIALRCDGKLFTLRANLREPSRQREAMQTPMLDRKGWHFSDESGEVWLREGERVEVTGLFNYSEKGFFVELSQQEAGSSREARRQRRRMRFRVMTEAPLEDPDAQAAEGLALLRRVLDLPAEAEIP